MANGTDIDAPPQDTDVEEPAPSGSLAGMQQPLEGGGMSGPFSGPSYSPRDPATMAPSTGFHPLNNLRAMLAARGAPGAPTVSQVAQQHGGLLTGLAGVLLDGISAGMHAQATAPLYGAPGSNFARGFVQNEQMPLLRQQQQQAMWDSMSAVQKDQAGMLKAHVQDMQTRAALQRAGEDALMGMTEDQRKQLDQDQQDGITEKVYESDNYDDVQNHLNELRHAAGVDGIDYWAKPTSLTWDDQGNPIGSHWVIIKDDPNKTLGTDRSFQVPDGVDDDGNMTMRTAKAPAGMRVRDYRKFEQDVRNKGVVQWDLAAKQQAGLGAGAADQGFAIGPDGRLTEMSRAEAAKAHVLNTWEKANEGQMTQQRTATAMTNDVQQNVSHYRMAMNKVFSEPITAAQSAMLDALTPKALGLDIGHIGSYSIGFTLPEVLQKMTDAGAFSVLSDSQAEAMIDFYATMASVPVAQKAMIQVGRTTDEMSGLEIRTIPTPLMDQRTFGIGMDRFQGNLTQAASKNVRMRGMKTTEDLRQEIESGNASPATQPAAALPGGGAGARAKGQVHIKIPNAPEGKQDWNVPAANLDKVLKRYPGATVIP